MKYRYSKTRMHKHNMTRSLEENNAENLEDNKALDLMDSKRGDLMINCSRIVTNSKKRALMTVLMPLLMALLIQSVVVAGVPDDVRVYITDFERHELRNTMQENASRFLSGLNVAWIEQRLPEVRRPEISDQLASDVTRLWETAPMHVPDDRLFLRVMRTTDGQYEMRDIPLLLLDEEGGTVYEEGVLLFSPSGNLAGMRIAVPQHQYSRLMREGVNEIDRTRRRHILDFTESFRTAYNTKDIDYIRKVFSDQALIVVGRMIEQADESSPYEQQVEYLRFNKEEYLERLERVFRINRFIDVTFDDVRIHRHPIYEDIYGVNMEQYYTSSTYSDEGFLFLLVDFHDPEAPMIHVRTWQPMRATPEHQVFQLGDMEIL